MPIPPVLRALLSAHGPSGYETAPAAVFRDAASAYAEVTTDVMGSVWRPGARDGRGPDAGHRRPHRRDRPHRHPHRRQRLPALHRRRRLGSADPRRPAGRRGHARRGRSRAWSGASRSTCSRTTTARRSRAWRSCTSTSAPRTARRRARACASATWRSSRASPVELPNDRAVARSMDNRLGCYVAYEAARLVARGRRRARRRRRPSPPCRRRRPSAARTTAYALRPDLAIVVDVTHATDAPGVDVNELGAHPFGSGPVIERGSNLNPRVVELLYETAEAEAIPFTVQASGALAPAPTWTPMHSSRGASRAAAWPAAALHALAGRDGAARGRRQRGAADRRGRAASDRGDQLRAVRAAPLRSPPSPWRSPPAARRTSPTRRDRTPDGP